MNDHNKVSNENTRYIILIVLLAKSCGITVLDHLARSTIKIRYYK